MRTYQKRTLPTDSRGNFRCDCGLKADGKPPRFYLGKDEQQAVLRRDRIRRLWTLIEASSTPYWTEITQDIGRAIGRGETTYNVPTGERTDRQLALSIGELNRQFGTLIACMPVDFEAYYRGRAELQGVIDGQIESKRKALETKLALVRNSVAMDENRTIVEFGSKSLVFPSPQLSGPMLHAVLDAYGKEYKALAPKLPTGEDRPNTRKEVERMGLLKNAHSDFSLSELNKDRIAHLIAHWRGRPTTKRGGIASRDYAATMIKQLFRVFRWLDGTNKYDWQMPRGLDSINRKIDRVDSEKKLSAVTKEVYNPAELAHLSATATDWQRLALYLGLNCGMGAAELGRVVVDDLILDQVHPYARQLGIKTTETDCYLRYFRPKTSVFGEWWLWPETVEMVRWGIKRAKKIGSDLLFCRETGTPLYDMTNKNPGVAFANVWDRMKKQAGITVKGSLPFGSLRDTLPDHLRMTYSSELASLCLTHGTPGVDKLIDCYSNKPWRQFHEAMQASHAHFAPLWAVHRSPK